MSQANLESSAFRVMSDAAATMAMPLHLLLVLLLLPRLLPSPHTAITMTAMTASDAKATEAMDAVNLYGQRSQPDETPDFLLKSHRLLLDEIDKLPNEKKAGWLMAREKCDPTLVGEDHRLMFLRCELFNIEVRQ